VSHGFDARESLGARQIVKILDGRLVDVSWKKLAVELLFPQLNFLCQRFAGPRKTDTPHMRSPSPHGRFGPLPKNRAPVRRATESRATHVLSLATDSLKKAPPALAATISQIKQADGAKVLSPAVLNDRAGLVRLLARHADAVAIIIRILTRAMIDGLPVRSIRSWSYFEGPIEDERAANEFEQLGLPPGDCFGAHKRKGQGHA
jgi:hypothetical protein